MAPFSDARLQRLTGVFDVSLYPPNLRIKALKAACTDSTSPTTPYVSDSPYSKFRSNGEKGETSDSLEGFDLGELRKRLRSVDGAEVRRKKQMLNRVGNVYSVAKRQMLMNPPQLYQEALMTERPGRGMSFTAMMLLLAHYKLIDDTALRYVQRSRWVRT